MNEFLSQFELILAGARQSAMLMLLALLIYSCKAKPKNCEPIIHAMIIYWFVVFTNSIVSNYIDRELGRTITALVGTPILFVKVIGVWMSHRGPD